MEPLQPDMEQITRKLTRVRLEGMREAGAAILGSYRALEKAGANLVGQCLANQGTFFELEHYPKGDVFDEETASQYYYHAHRPESGEHGHFHCFLRFEGMPDGMEPVPYSGEADRPEGEEAVCHLIAISMNGQGFPTHLFTTNRWVTDETFYSAADTLELVDRFSVDHVFPCLAVNNWITAMLRLFWPQIRELLKARDEVIRKWALEHPGVDVFEDRGLDLTSIMEINTDDQIALVEAALKK
jgi:hypothetical protein